MAIWMPGQVVSIEQFRYHDWDAVGWLQEIGSPRARDMQQLGIWCLAAGQRADIDARILLTMLEKEQSFVTLPSLSPHRHDWAMGFGVYPDGTHLATWRGESNVGPEAQIKHAAIRLRELADGKDPRLTPNMGFAFENGPTRALYTYNPSVSGNYNFWVIFHRWFDDGDGSSGELPPQQPQAEAKALGATKGDVANVAREACEAHRAGRRTCTIHGVTFDLATTGWCGRFVRQCHAAAVRAYDPGFDEFGFGWLAANAWEACHNLRAQGYETTTAAAKPGDIVGLNRTYSGPPGHIGIYLGDHIAENTSRHGLGTVLTPASELAGRVSGYYSVLPSMNANGDPMTPGVAIVYPADAQHAKRVDCAPFIGSDGRMYAQAAPLVQALGFTAHYREQHEGDRLLKRLYVKEAGV
jgi:hypothetical protein